jgi:UDP-2,3-diacylglucosamine pyrophosphatase LpxH
MILAVSDLHLGYDEKCNRDDFARFLDLCNGIDIDHLVLLGDILDFWRRNNARIVMDGQNGKILSKLMNMSAREVHYVAGNHDYYMLKLCDRYGKNCPFTVTKNLRIEDNGSRFYFTHGYEFEVLINLEPISIESYEGFCEQMCFNNDTLGGYASSLWDLLKKCRPDRDLDKLTQPPAERENIDQVYYFVRSEGKRVLTGMAPDEKLVYGHTHRPFINPEGTVANTGSWVNELSREKSQNRYVRIENGRMDLRAFDIDDFP